jgi:hypothetical protein
MFIYYLKDMVNFMAEPRSKEALTSRRAEIEKLANESVKHWQWHYRKMLDEYNWILQVSPPKKAAKMGATAKK